MSLKDLDKCEQRTRSNFIPSISVTYSWSGPKKKQYWGEETSTSSTQRGATGYSV